jgi:hypothetical protein
MAGAGYKLFNTGDVLTAAQVNTYLNEQTVMVFADSAARTTALSGVLAEGMMSYLQDTNAVEVYNGTSWVNVGNAGDITEVQAGVGISIASGTGPIPVITNSSTDLITTAGDLLYGTAADTVARLGIGTAGQVLQVNSGATAPEWAAPASSGVNKNYLINGGFAIAQRGTTFASGANNDDAYTLDRWYILSDTNDVIDVTQDTTTVPTNGQFAIALDVETINKKFGIATIIENKDIIGLVGNTVTFSFKAKVSATTKLDNVKAAIVSWSGTADSVTSDIISAWNVEGTNPTLIANATYENSPVNLNLTTSYATYSVSGAVDTASTKNLILFIWSDVTDTTLGDFLYIAEAKLELGSSGTAFQYAGGTIQGELAACQRYFNRAVDGSINTNYRFSGGQCKSTTAGEINYSFPVRMRTSPTLSVSDPSHFFLLDASAGSSGALTGISGAILTPTNGRVDASGASGLVAGNATSLQSTSASSRLDFSAEL